MKHVFFIALFIFLSSCGDRKQEIIDMSERTPQSKRNYDDLDTANVNLSDGILAEFQQWNPEIIDYRPSKERNFLERFRPDSTDNYVWYLSDDDSLKYQRTVFKDSVKTKSAFYNWMDHEEISFFGANERISKEPLAILFTDTMILMLKGNVDLDYWEDFFLEEKWMAEGDYWITQKKYGKAQWFVHEDDEFKNLTDN